jgi:hypothetical protein
MTMTPDEPAKLPPQGTRQVLAITRDGTLLGVGHNFTPGVPFTDGMYAVEIARYDAVLIIMPPVLPDFIPAGAMPRALIVTYRHDPATPKPSKHVREFYMCAHKAGREVFMTDDGVLTPAGVDRAALYDRMMRTIRGDP